MGCTTSYRSSKFIKQPDTFIRKEPKAEAAPTPDFKDVDRYHSAYKTDNPYYDGRNMILDGDIYGAVDVLSKDIHSLDYPSRASLWVFISKCRLDQRREALEFLKEFVIPLQISPEDQGVIPTMLMYYLGDLKEETVLKRMSIWDNLDRCPAYYYFGAHKKYYEGDFVTGNDYIARCLRTNMDDYSEFKFAETEVRGFTSRNPGQYTDFPISQLSAEGAGFSLPNFEDTIPRDLDEAQLEHLEGYLDALPDEFGSRIMEQIPTEVGEDQYLVPSVVDETWEVVDEEELMQILQDETSAMVDYMMEDKDYFTISNASEIHFIPSGGTYETYAITYDEFLENSVEYEDDFDLDYSQVALYLKSGDMLAGVRVPCETYDFYHDLYGQNVVITINALFTVREDRRVEMVTHFFGGYKEERYQEE
ncbi:MAG: hypothetical protein ACYTG7_15930 [Planctomycetota bacterium]|jgi:hypothetical protein